ncbi:hypothetical protein Acr_00g0085970 [Actinidia rufa]|uniref:Uncharacterized protein n=1 Tax=Actinidia rufa TaxID=165716 RepID=A0A7J0DWA1_9ERIC|nr:hypothetical protein Acr_00g0085970 [Actinidia rufa]
MWNVLSFQYDQAKNYEIQSIRNWMGRLWNEIFNHHHGGFQFDEWEFGSGKCIGNNFVGAKIGTFGDCREVESEAEQDGTLTVLREPFLPLTEEEEAEEEGFGHSREL